MRTSLIAHALLILTLLLTNAFSQAATTRATVYIPNGIHITATIKPAIKSPYESPDTTYQNYGDIEAWYFKESCIVSQTYRPPTGPPEKRVYSYWYDEDSRGNNPTFQQWGTPRAFLFLPDKAPPLPPEAMRVNPLWYMIEANQKLFSGNQPIQVQLQEDGRNIIKVLDKPFISEPRDDNFEYSYLLERDRIHNITLTVHTTYHKQKSAPNFVPPLNHSDVAYQLNASGFDIEFPAIPRKITMESRYGTDRTIEISSIKSIPSELAHTDLLNKLTQDFHQVALNEDGYEIQRSVANFTVTSLTGDKANLADLTKEKTTLIFSWASWAPGSEAVIDAVKTVHDTMGDENDVAILSISLDTETTAAKENVRRNAMPWQNYLIPVKQHRSAINTFTKDKELPSAMIIDRHGVITRLNSEEIISSTKVYDLQSRFTSKLENDRAAKKAGGYAKLWLGPQVLEILSGFENAEICTLTGDHMEELKIAAAAPLPPPILQPGHLLTVSSATPKVNNMPTSVSILGNYPVKSKAPIRNISSTRSIVKMLTDDKAIVNQYGEEAFPSPARAILFRKGEHTVGVTGAGPDIEIYLDDEKIAWLWLSPKATEQLKAFYASLDK